MVDEVEIDVSKADDAVKEMKKISHFRRDKLTQGQLVTRLADEIRELTKDMLLPSPDGKERHMVVYEQLLPLRESEEDVEPFPYCVVKFSSSQLKDVSERETVDILLDFGIYYDAPDRQYHYILFHIFNLLRRRFLADNFMENFRCEPEMTFALSPTDEETYPYFFGAVGMKWAVLGIEREVDFWNQ